ncbi:MAG: RNA polymerase sigma factor [Phycisphaerae bacterium]
MWARKSEEGSERLSRRAEKKLIDRARAGDEASARQLVEAHKDRLFAFVWRIVRDHHDAEEICQDAFMRAFSSLDTFRPEYRFSTWLFTIGYRLCLNWIRRKHAVTGELDVTALPSGREDPADELAQSEDARRLKDAIWDAVDQLSVPQRATVLLYYREGQSCQEVAETMQIPVATVKSHLHRARACLRSLLSHVADDWSKVSVLRENAS